MFTRYLMALVLSGAIALAQNSTQVRTEASPKATARITKEVRHELIMLPNLSLFDHLAYKVDGYNVTLMGYVRNPSLKNEAQNVVKDIEGVEKIDNQIKVLPPSPNDDRIRERVARAIFNTPGLFPYAMGAVPPLHIIVDGGHVILAGVVNSQGDKNLAEIKAKSVSGVFSVTNDLQVSK